MMGNLAPLSSLVILARRAFAAFTTGGRNLEMFIIYGD